MKMSKLAIPTQRVTIVVFCIISFYVVGSAVKPDCVIDSTSQTCRHYLPRAIKPDVTEVFVTNFASRLISMQNHVFRNSSWKNVNKLDITFKIISDSIGIHDYDFDYLDNVTYLGLHSMEIDFISFHAFAGLQNLEHLDLSNCLDICQDILFDSLSNVTIAPKLKALNLNGMCTAHGNSLMFDKKIVLILKQRRIEWLSLSGTNIFVADSIVDNVPFHLTYLDISNITYFDDFRTNTTEHVVIALIENIKVLNISLFPIRFLGINLFKWLSDRYDDTFITNCTDWPKTLEVLNVSYILPYEVIIHSEYWDFSKCIQLNTETITARGNNLKIVNVTLLWPAYNNITEVDFSFNKLEFFSRNVLNHLASIKRLLLSNNRLFQMERTDDFKRLTETFLNLEYLYLDFNKLTSIPYNMFAKNTALQGINLRGNFLNSIHFRVSHLSNLRILDLQDNYIKFIDLNVISQMSIINTRSTNNTQSYLNFSLYGNPLQCSCKNVDFLKWFLHQRVPLNASTHCFYKGNKIQIDDQALDNSKYSCFEMYIAALSAVSAFIVACVVLVISSYMYRKMKKDKRIELKNRFLQYFRKHRQYLAFLSYCNSDGDLVLQTIYKELNDMLREMSGDQRNMVCVGEKDFMPGKSIFDEISRCLDNSCVVIFIVSEAFCESEWCRTEIREACTRNKPMIIILTETVAIEKMPSYLQNIFQTIVRVKLLQQDDGQYILKPNSQKLCEAIIDLASENYS